MTTALRVVCTKRAADQAERALQWWREHRPAAPDLLQQELRDVLSLVATAPSLGAVARDGRLGEVRRVLLRRTRYYVFYRAQFSNGDLEVLAVWHARGSTNSSWESATTGAGADKFVPVQLGQVGGTAR